MFSRFPESLAAFRQKTPQTTANCIRIASSYLINQQIQRVLLAKLVKGGGKQGRRDKLLRALDDAARHYKDSNQKVRQAFFHGLLTGYAVALTLR